MTEVFADAFYFIALLNPSDQHHAEAVRVTRGLSAPLVTTSSVLIEVADALAVPGIRPIVHRFLEQLPADPNTKIVEIDAAWQMRGLALFGARPDKSWSLTDCISFVVMAERGITEALTGDHHFEQAGYRAVMNRR